MRPGEMVANGAGAKPLGPKGTRPPNRVSTGTSGCLARNYLTWSAAPYDPARNGWSEADVTAFREKRDR